MFCRAVSSGACDTAGGEEVDVGEASSTGCLESTDSVAEANASLDPLTAWVESVVRCRATNSSTETSGRHVGGGSTRPSAGPVHHDDRWFERDGIDEELVLRSVSAGSSVDAARADAPTVVADGAVARRSGRDHRHGWGLVPNPRGDSQALPQAVAHPQHSRRRHVADAATPAISSPATPRAPGEH